MTTKQMTLQQQFNYLVPRMKSIGLISVIPQRPIESTKAVQAAKVGMTEAEYNRSIYIKRKALKTLGV